MSDKFNIIFFFRYKNTNGNDVNITNKFDKKKMVDR